MIPQLEKLKGDELVSAFCAWVAQQESGAAGSWLATLDAPQQKHITQEIASFCEDAGFELGWVVQNQLDNAELDEALGQAMLHHLNGLHQASAAQPLLTRYKTTVTWLNNLSARKYRTDTRAIYTRLVHAGNIPPASADALLDNNKNRWQHVTNALHTAYQSDPDAVVDAVQAVMLSDAPDTEKSPRNWLPFNRQPEPTPAT